jgi:hypothetical protein
MDHSSWQKGGCVSLQLIAKTAFFQIITGIFEKIVKALFFKPI